MESRRGGEFHHNNITNLIAINISLLNYATISDIEYLKKLVTRSSLTKIEKADIVSFINRCQIKEFKRAERPIANERYDLKSKHFPGKISKEIPIDIVEDNETLSNETTQNYEVPTAIYV